MNIYGSWTGTGGRVGFLREFFAYFNKQIVENHLKIRFSSHICLVSFKGHSWKSVFLVIHAQPCARTPPFLTHATTTGPHCGLCFFWIFTKECAKKSKRQTNEALTGSGNFFVSTTICENKSTDFLRSHHFEVKSGDRAVGASTDGRTRRRNFEKTIFQYPLPRMESDKKGVEANTRASWHCQPDNEGDTPFCSSKWSCSVPSASHFDTFLW